MLTAAIATAQNTGVGTTAPRAKLEVNGNTITTENTHIGKWHHILDYKLNDNAVNGYKIITNLPYQDYNQMPLIKIQGYAYGSAQTIDINLVYYIFDGKFTNVKATNNGSWAPNIKLANEGGKVVIFLDGTGYFTRFNIQAFENMQTDFTQFEGWSVVDAPISGTNITDVPYEQVLPGTVRMPGISAPAGTTNALSINENGVLSSTPLSAAINQNAEWYYDSASNEIRLRRSGTAPFKNKIFYNSSNGNYLNSDNPDYTTTAKISNFISSPNVTSYFESSIDDPGADAKTVEQTIFSINSDEGLVPRNYKTVSSISLGSGVTQNVERLYNMMNYTSKSNNANTTFMIGNLGGTSIYGNGSITGYMTGNYSTASASNGNGNINRIQTNQNRIFLGQNSTHQIDNIEVNASDILFDKNSAPNVNNAVIYDAVISAMDTSNPKIVGFSAYKFDGLTPRLQSLIQTAYGLRIGAMGSDSNKYSIFTDSGKISFGDKLQLRTINDSVNESTSVNDKILVADADGYVKTQSAASVGLASEPWRVTGTTDPASINTQNIYQLGNVTVGRTSDDPTLEPNITYPEYTVGGNSFKSYTTFAVPSVNIQGKSYSRLQGSGLSLFSRSTDNGGNVGGQSEIVLRAGSLTEDISSINTNAASIRKYGNDANTLPDMKNHLYINNRLNGGTTIAFTDNNELDFRIGGYFIDTANSKMIIKTNGNVGIGTRTPSETLDVVGKIKSSSLAGTGDRIVVSDANGVLKNGDITTISAASEPWRIQDTTNPATNNTQNIYQLGTVAIGANNSAGSELLVQDVDNNGATVRFKNTDQVGWNLYALPSTDSNPNGFILENLDAVSTNYVRRFSITQNGSIGLGVATPVSRLHIPSVGAFTRSAILVESGETPFKISAYEGTTGINTLVGEIGMEYDAPTLGISNKNAMIKFYRGGNSNDGVMAFTSGADTERMRITAAGNIGIGTSTPSEKLEVVGNVRANSFISSTTTYPDYVFQNYYTDTSSHLNPSYTFTTLAETEKFIKENGHLPGFKKAEEVVKEGSFNVSETSLKSLEKIEELYLHMIDLEKRVQTLEAENRLLKAGK